MMVDEFVGQLSSISLPNVFNPYRDVCSVSDHPGSPAIRRQNLRFFLNAVLKREARSVWLGRDLGYLGGRRTGIALTDEFHLATLEKTFGVVGLLKATTSEEAATKERTATEVWKLLTKINEPIVLWNAFPFHPFDEDQPLSNRRHTAQEFDLCRQILATLLEWLEPETVIALGADAEAAVLNIGRKCERVRHPSYGGQTDFDREISRIYARSSLIMEESHFRLLQPCTV